MKASLNWLKTFIEIHKTPIEIEEILTSTGLEIEHFEETFSVKGGLKGIVIGEVISCQKHPNADKLNLTQVNIGSEHHLSIVCGAPNVAVGQKVLVATVGTTVNPIVGEPFTIQKAKIRGENSEGMICADDEIGLGTSHDGIRVLPENAPIGVLASDYFNIESDCIFEIGLTANRGDAASQLGVARELGTVLNTPVLMPKMIETKAKLPFNVEISIQNTIACPRYSAVVVKGLAVKDSPDWLKNKLLSIGVKPINHIVDVTNFVLHELGQPLHAFDLSKIKKNNIIVKTAQKGEVFKTLDGSQLELKGNELMICDTESNLCLAGVYGGLESGVNQETTEILIESAYFSADFVRKSAKQHGLSTDSSYRFERGTDPEMTINALKRALLLLQETNPNLEFSEIKDVYPEVLKPFEVNLRLSQIEKIAGISINENQIENILKGLGIQIVSKQETIWALEVPRFKSDVCREIDVIEELLRIHGLNNIPLKKELNSALNYAPTNQTENVQKQITTLLMGMGFNEIMTNSLTSDKYYEDKSKLVFLSNPLSTEMNVMRQSMLFSALESVAYNKNRKQNNTHFFEFGKTYVKSNDKTFEKDELILICSGFQHQESWENKQKPADFYFLKSIAKRIFDAYKLPLKKLNILSVEKETLKLFGIKDQVYYCVLNWKDFLSVGQKKDFVLKDIPVFPVVRRDLSLVVDQKVTFKQVEDIAKKLNTKLLNSINVFDVYQGKPLENHQKSMSISFEFYDETKTLSDQEIDPLMTVLMQEFETKIQAIIRK